MQTKTAITLAGSTTALAELLGISLSAISQWGENVPELRVYKLRELKPDWFLVTDRRGGQDRRKGERRVASAVVDKQAV